MNRPAAFLIALHIANAAQAAQPSVWVFTAEGLPAVQHQASADRLFVLGRGADALRGLSFINPGTEEEARAQALRILQSPRGQSALQTVRQGAQATTIAWLYGIAQLPAVLVDERYVVYGDFDVELAVQRVEAIRRAH